MDEATYNDPATQDRLGREWEALCESVGQQVVDPATGIEDDYGLNDSKLGDADRPALEAMRKETRWWRRGGLFGFLNVVLPRRRRRLQPAERLMQAVRKAAMDVRSGALLGDYCGEEKQAELRRVNEAAQRVLAEMHDEHGIVRPQVLADDQYPDEPITKGQVCRVLRAGCPRRMLTENDSRLFQDEVVGGGVHVIQISREGVLVNLTQLALAFPDLTDSHVELLRHRRTTADVELALAAA